jgi:radical SAM protein with 4Fe4S-binding SPASM domain
MNPLFRKIHSDLPVFKIDHFNRSIIYTPGYSVVLSNDKAEEFDNLKNGVDFLKGNNEFQGIIEKAQNAVIAWNAMKLKAFSTDCFTIHTGSNCNLNCTYCYAKNKSTGNDKLKGFPDINMIQAVLEKILTSKKRTSEPLTIVYHGSGEPTIYWEEMLKSFHWIKNAVQKRNVKIFTYIATNGSLKDEQIEWMSKHINLIGISCDGPKEIQNEQRSSKTEFLRPLEEVCRKILQHGGKFDIRVTITKTSLTKQLEIVKYLIHECFANHIRIEPVYLAEQDGFSEDDGEIFFNNYKMAQNYATSKGSSYTYSGVRMEEIHGTYCDSLRNNLRLTSDGLTRNCFCFMNDEPAFITGNLDRKTGNFELSDAINCLKAKNSEIPQECFNCINVFHCSRGCPDFCISEAGKSTLKLNRFRCRLHQLITVDKLKFLADHIS